MATVFKARSGDTGETVAVKVLHPFLSKDRVFRERFAREAKILRSLSHPRIVALQDFGEQDGLLYLVMPFMNVGSLSDRLNEGPVNVREGARVVAQIASALQYAHDRGVVHRDVKPSNILMDGEGRAWLADFGFAHMDDASLSLTGSGIIGTPAYMAPEQIRGVDISPKSDQYALGVILFQMSTGCLPYNGDTPMAVAIKHATEPLPIPRMVNHNLPDAVEEVIIKACSKDPQDRYRDIASLNEAFQDAILRSVDPVSGALRPGAVSAPVKAGVIPAGRLPDAGSTWWRSRRKAALLALLLLLLVCPASVVGSSQLGIVPAQNQELEDGTSPGPHSNARATWERLSTGNAGESGLRSTPGAIDTAVAGTLAARSAIETATGSSTQAVGEGLPGFETTASPSGTLPGLTVSGTSTNTPGPGLPTGTRAPTETTTGTATTVLPSSASPTPTRTRTVTPSLVPTTMSTAVPTLIVPPDPCMGVYMSGFTRIGEELSLTVSNSCGSARMISAIRVDWPANFGELKKIKLDDDEIWEGELKTPPMTLIGAWGLPNGQLVNIKFTFEEETSGGKTMIQISFDNGCELDKIG